MSSAPWRKSADDTASGHSGGTTSTSARSWYAATSCTRRCSISRVKAWIAVASAERGGDWSAQATPAGSTTTRSAPSATAWLIGVLSATPPSNRSRPSISTAGSTAGMVDGGVARPAAAEQERAADPPRREHGRDGRRCENGQARVSGRQHDLGARQHVGGDDVHGDPRVLEPVVADVGVDEPPQPVW